jgi:drug/metabolite transporter (DMT)-like permease
MSVAIAAHRPAIEYRRGALLVTGATVVWSSAGLLARLVATDPWTTLFWRSIFAGSFLLLYLAWREGAGLLAAFRRLGAAGTAMGVCFGISMICFINALSMTTVAAVLVFQAAAPLFAAAMARAFLGERVSRTKLAAIIVSFAGVLLIVSGADSVGSLWGNLVSAVMGVTYAATIVLARARPDVPTTEASVLGILIVAIASAPLAAFHVSAPDLGLFAVFGIFQMGIALIMFTAGVRLIPSADAGLISVLESVLAPLLVWAVFNELPGTPTLIGGTIVIAAVLAAAIIERDAAG